MKHKGTCLFLLFLCAAAVLVSCGGSEAYYKSGRYEKAVEAADRFETPGEKDFLYKARALCALNRKEEATDAVLLYLLMSDSGGVDREFAVDLFIDLGFSATLDILLLKPEDGLKAQITLYKACTELNDTENARHLLSAYLSSALGFADFTTLIVNFPVEPEYTAAVFQLWLPHLEDSERSVFADLLSRYSESEELTEDCARVCISLAESLLEDEFFQNDPVLLSKLYRIMGTALEKLHDTYNSAEYFRLSNSTGAENSEGM